MLFPYIQFTPKAVTNFPKGETLGSVSLEYSIPRINPSPKLLQAIKALMKPLQHHHAFFTDVHRDCSLTKKDENMEEKYQKPSKQHGFTEVTRTPRHCRNIFCSTLQLSMILMDIVQLQAPLVTKSLSLSQDTQFIFKINWFSSFKS